jgi:CBS domain-containing protein
MATAVPPDREPAIEDVAATGVWAWPARAVMQAPLASGDLSLTVRQALALMQQRRIGSLGVVDDHGQLHGLLTFRSLAAGLTHGAADAEAAVSAAVWETPRTITSDTPLWQAQQNLARFGVKYLVVMEADRPAGMLSQSDLLYTLLSCQRPLLVQIEAAASFAELRDWVNRLGTLAADLRQHNRSAERAIRALSELHLAIQRRGVELVLADLAAEGQGAPPLPFAFLILGAGGRKEMLLNSDQDNAIILADAAASDAAGRAWFPPFCERVNHRLDELGYAWCSGGIMACQPDFHKTLADWQQQFSDIAEFPTAHWARWTTVFGDFATLYGDDRLTFALRRHWQAELRRKPRLLQLLVEDDANGTPALGLFNRLVTASDPERRGRIDLKRNGTRLLADAARVYAFAEGIAATHTGDRLRALQRQGRLTAEFGDTVLAAYEELLALTLDHQLRQVVAGEVPDKLLRLRELTPVREETLRMAMRVIKQLQGRMQGEFGTIRL